MSALEGKVEVFFANEENINFIATVPMSKIIEEIAKVTSTSTKVNPERLKVIVKIHFKLSITCLIELIAF